MRAIVNLIIAAMLVVGLAGCTTTKTQQLKATSSVHYVTTLRQALRQVVLADRLTKRDAPMWTYPIRVRLFFCWFREGRCRNRRLLGAMRELELLPIRIDLKGRQINLQIRQGHPDTVITQKAGSGRPTWSSWARPGGLGFPICCLAAWPKRCCTWCRATPW